MVDVDKVLKNTVKKGNVKIGTRLTKRAINDGIAKFVVLANNCPHAAGINKLASSKNIPVYQYDSTSIDLGYACGKAFAVSVFAVLDDGDSTLLQLVKKGS